MRAFGKMGSKVDTANKKKLILLYLLGNGPRGKKMEKEN
jgi:hypothetical protein